MDLQKLRDGIDRKLSTDEIVEYQNYRNELINELENLSFSGNGDYLLLKWGTIKGQSFKKNKECFELIQKYASLGRSGNGVMTQHDTDEQKKILCEIIDKCNGVIQNDWTGKYMKRADAKEYVLSYGEEK